jgi:hypothetical protein
MSTVIGMIFLPLREGKKVPQFKVDTKFSANCCSPAGQGQSFHTYHHHMSDTFCIWPDVDMALDDPILSPLI